MCSEEDFRLIIGLSNLLFSGLPMLFVSADEKTDESTFPIMEHDSLN